MLLYELKKIAWRKEIMILRKIAVRTSREVQEWRPSMRKTNKGEETSKVGLKDRNQHW